MTEVSTKGKDKIVGYSTEVIVCVWNTVCTLCAVGSSATVVASDDTIDAVEVFTNVKDVFIVS